MRHSVLRFLWLSAAGFLFIRPAFAQETVIPSSGANDFILSEGILYWIVGPDPDCFTSGTGGSIRRASAGGGAITTMLAGTACFSPRLLRVDDAYVYFVDGTSIQRLWTGASGTGVPQTITTSVGTITDMEVDSFYLYWIDDEGIKRRLKDGTGSDVPYFDPFFLATELATPRYGSSFLFWLEELAGFGQARGRAKADLSGPVANASPSVADPSLLTLNDFSFVFDSYVYWAEPDARVQRARSNGTDVVELSPGSVGSTVRGLVADDTNAYWAEYRGAAGTGALRRANRDGAGLSTVLTSLDLVGGLQQDEWYLYFTEDNAIKRVRKDATVTTGDLTWQQIEITQAVQRLTNTVSLAEGKETFVRAYPTVFFAPFTNVRAQLHAMRGGVPLASLDPINDSLSLPVGGPFVRNTRKVFVFSIPPSWRFGTLTIEVEINPDRALPETNFSNNIIARTITYTETDPICLHMWPVLTSDPDTGASDPLYTADSPGFWNNIARFESMWPVGGLGILVIPESTTVTRRGGRPFRWPDDEKKIIGRIGNARDGAFRCAVADDYDSGMVNPDAFFRVGGGVAGRGQRPGSISYSVMANVDFTNIDQPFGGAIMAQELGHNLNRRHVDCPVGGPENIDGAYPYPTCQIGPDGDAAGPWGYDPLTDRMINPRFARDYMSYSGPTWTSDYTWEAILAKLAAGARSERVEPQPNHVDDAAIREPLKGVAPADAQSGPGSCGTTGTGDCCEAGGNGTPFCEDPNCCEVVCACDPYCCGFEWDSACATVGYSGNGCGAQLLCASCFGAASDQLYISGTIAEAAGEARIEVAQRVPPGFYSVDPASMPRSLGPAESLADGVPTIELATADGTVLSTFPLNPIDHADHDDNSLLGYTELVPFEPATDEIRVTLSGAILARRSVSPNPPTVQIHEPMSGDMPTSTLDIKWSGSDPDAQPLTYLVQYSPDNGSTWRAVALDEPDTGTGITTLTLDQLDTSLLPGSANPAAPGSSRIRVTACDGVNTAIAVSEPFLLGNRRPRVHLERPRDGMRFRHTDQVPLRGRAFDPEDGQIPDASYDWFVNGGFAGTGMEYMIPRLPPGVHSIELVAYDAMQDFGSDKVNVLVITGMIEDSTCCEDLAGPGCDDNDCMQAVCACDPFCCNTAWDQACGGFGSGGNGCGARVLCRDICAGAGRDGDGDGTPDSVDNCPTAPNANQTDTDTDGRGDVCDNCPVTRNAQQEDADEDGLGDACDPCPAVVSGGKDDWDRDCIPNAIDLCPMNPQAQQVDTDQDGMGDGCDNCPQTHNPSQFDCDDDGVGDACTIALLGSPDCNGNGVPDDCDLALGNSFDSKSDDIPDECCLETTPNLAFFIDCMNGPAADPHPARSLCQSVCLAIFDKDLSGTIDLYDFAQSGDDLAP